MPADLLGSSANKPRLKAAALRDQLPPATKALCWVVQNFEFVVKLDNLASPLRATAPLLAS
jgi:hypothetical protein